MPLHSTAWGFGEPDVLLLHGMMGAGRSWWRVAPMIADRGHRVIALDLPGHGDSPPLPDATVEGVADLVLQAWSSLSSMPPALAIGHSYGGTVLAAASEALQPVSAVYVDSPFTKRGGWPPETVREQYAADKAARTYEGLRQRRPFYSDEDCVVEARAAEQFDVETAVALAAGAGGDWTPNAPSRSLLLHPDPAATSPRTKARNSRLAAWRSGRSPAQSTQSGTATSPPS